ncbi:zyxin isoform X2 [Brienomyrus brachyistius]|nr:zyxin isoform X2 [Brienomyrus brachyistius]XP_048882527.1 zyxin isoform X2 [Brienomyrus brachyistius]XP_048882529.1 zyxin isoform X2 [Brienomyrus brachyistius]
MSDSSDSKPFVATSSITFKVTTPSFYNQPKKFASVAPPRPKSQTSQPQPAASNLIPASTAVIGRVGELPPPPPPVCDDFPPPPPPLDDADLPVPPPECQITPPAYEAPPPAFPAPPSPPPEDFPIPSAPEDISSQTYTPPPPPPPPPPPLPPPSSSNHNNSQRLMEKQTSFDRQLDSLTDLLSEMETRGPFNPKLPTQAPVASAPKPSGPPATAPKPLSFLPPPELQDRPPPAPWAEELKARTTNRQANQGSASTHSQPPPANKTPTVTPKTGFLTNQGTSNNKSPAFGSKGGVTAPSTVTKAPNSITPSFALKPAPSNSFPPPPVNQNVPKRAVSPVFNHSKTSPAASHENVSAPTVASQSKPISSASPPCAQSAGPPASKPAQPAGSGSGSGSGSGLGMPLSMREVEELEKMTQDFIKNMDAHAPVITSAPTEVCGKCRQALSRSQPAVRAMDKLFHSDCFCCMSCQRPLQGLQFYDRDGQPQCEDCFVNSLPMCARCGEHVTDRVLKAVGQSFHAHCFRCSTCDCSLEGAPFITDDDSRPYCVSDYHRRFSPVCVSCKEPIVPDPGSEETVRVVALDKNFHLKCYRCEDCARPLSIEADADGCYPLDGRILCMKCHTHRVKQAAH